MNSSQLLEGWCTWLLAQDKDNNAAKDRTGQIVVDRNTKPKRNNPWYIPGTWGDVSVPVREIHVPPQTELFVVAASSHATDKEVIASGIQNPSDDDIKNHAKEIDDAWFNVTLRKGSPADSNPRAAQLTVVKTRVFDVDIDETSPYLKLAQISKGRARMASIGHVHQFQPDQGDTRLIIAAQSPEKKIGKRKELQYNVQVEYLIHVP